MHYPQKNTLYLLVLLLFISFPYSSHAGETSTYNQDKPSIFQKTKSWWKKHKPGRERELRELRELKLELKAKEELLGKMETGLASIVENARPLCPNGTVSVSVDEGPLIELRNELAALRVRIKELEQ